MPHLQHTHTHARERNARMCASGLRKTDIPFFCLFLFCFWIFLMYFNIFGFVSAKKKIHVPSIAKQLLLPP